MAGLLDQFKSPAQVQADLLKQQRDEMQAAIQRAPNRRARGVQSILAGLQAAGQGGLLGESIKEDLTSFDEAPEMVEAKRKASIAKQVSEIEITPGSSQHMFEVARIAKEAGDEVTAVNALMKAGTLQKAETSAAAKADLQQKEFRSQQLSRIPSDARTAVFASNKQMLGEFAGLSGTELDKAHAEVIRVNDTKRLKDAKALDQMRRVSTTRSTSGSLEGTQRLLAADGIGGHSFENRWGVDSEEKLGQFVTAVDAQVLDLQDTLANKGIRTNPDELTAIMLQKAKAQGAMNWNSPSDVDHIDVDAVRTIFKEMETEMLGTQEQRPSANPQAQGTPSKRRRVVLQ